MAVTDRIESVLKKKNERWITLSFKVIPTLVNSEEADEVMELCLYN